MYRESQESSKYFKLERFQKASLDVQVNDYNIHIRQTKNLKNPSKLFDKRIDPEKGTKIAAHSTKIIRLKKRKVLHLI